MEKAEEEKKLCQHCQKNEANPDHACPYAAEIGGDEESLCNCCEECTYQCCMDI